MARQSLSDTEDAQQTPDKTDDEPVPETIGRHPIQATGLARGQLTREYGCQAHA